MLQVRSRKQRTATPVKSYLHFGHKDTFTKWISYVVLAAWCVIYVYAISIQWTGYGGDNQWTNRINWSPDQVPTINDDVTISKGNVQVTVPAGANSLTMGTDFTTPANLTVFNSFFFGSGGLQIDGNGFLIINSGAAAVTGTVGVGGAVILRSGLIGGVWTVNSRGMMDMGGPAQKVLSACQLMIAGILQLSGVLALNQSSKVSVTSTAKLGGAVSIQAQDNTDVLFDTSSGTLTYSGGGEFQIQAPMKLGVFNFQGGNLTIYNDIAFSGNLTIPSGSFVSSVGTAVVQLAGGIAGSGVISAAGKRMTVGASQYSGVVNAVAGNLTFTDSAQLATVAVAGAQLNANGAVTVATLSLLAGSVTGSLQATNAYVKSPGFGLNGALTVSQQLLTAGTSLLAFGGSGALTIPSGATLRVGGALTLTGAPGPSVQNDGTIVAAYATTFQNINLGGIGSVSVSAPFKMTAAAVQQSKVNLSGGGEFRGTATQITSIDAVTGKPSVQATIGQYRFTCINECDNLRTSGTPTSDFSFRVGA